MSNINSILLCITDRVSKESNWFIALGIIVISTILKCPAHVCYVAYADTSPVVRHVAQ
jgi:hypothetical protein